jgi:hypothetical protein
MQTKNQGRAPRQAQPVTQAHSFEKYFTTAHRILWRLITFACQSARRAVWVRPPWRCGHLRYFAWRAA